MNDTFPVFFPIKKTNRQVHISRKFNCYGNSAKTHQHSAAIKLTLKFCWKWGTHPEYPQIPCQLNIRKIRNNMHKSHQKHRKGNLWHSEREYLKLNVFLLKAFFTIVIFFLGEIWDKTFNSISWTYFTDLHGSFSTKTNRHEWHKIPRNLIQRTTCCSFSLSFILNVEHSQMFAKIPKNPAKNRFMRKLHNKLSVY